MIKGKPMLNSGWKDADNGDHSLIAIRTLIPNGTKATKNIFQLCRTIKLFQYYTIISTISEIDSKIASLC